MKMKLSIINKEAKKVGDFEFSMKADIREDIFKRAVLAEMSLFRQEQGADPQAGKKHSISVSKRRRRYRTTYGKGGSRSPRKTMWARGRQLRFVGAFAPNTVGGRRAHAPKAEKNILKEINNKEWVKALQIGVVSSFNSDIVKLSGQRVPDLYPFVLDDSVENIIKTSEFKKFLETVGLTDEVQRTARIKVRAGRGKMRNRTYRVKRGPLVVVSSIESPLLKASRNVKGFDVVTPELLMVSDFGMSEKPGRMVLFTKSALENFVEVLN